MLLALDHSYTFQLMQFTELREDDQKTAFKTASGHEARPWTMQRHLLYIKKTQSNSYVCLRHTLNTAFILDISNILYSFNLSTTLCCVVISKYVTGNCPYISYD